MGLPPIVDRMTTTAAILCVPIFGTIAMLWIILGIIINQGKKDNEEMLVPHQWLWKHVVRLNIHKIGFFVLLIVFFYLMTSQIIKRENVEKELMEERSEKVILQRRCDETEKYYTDLRNKVNAFLKKRRKLRKYFK